MAFRLCFAVTALAVATMIAPARADTTVLAQAGAWAAFGGTTNGGIPVCGISTSPESRYFGMKLYSGDQTFTIQLSAKDWRIGDNRKYPLTMRFDQHREWNANGVGMHFADGDPGLQYEIRRQELAEFQSEFGDSGTLRIHFRTRGLKDWSLDLTGVKAVTDKFHACSKDLH